VWPIQNIHYKRCLLIILLFGITSCSSKIVYNNLDWLAAWYIDDYVTLTDAQESEFSPAFNNFLDWHRTSELNNYVNQIRRVQNEINDVETPLDIEGHIKAFKGFWFAILTKAEPDLVKLAYSLNNDQVAEFLQAAEQRNIDKVAEFQDSSKEEHMDDRLDKIKSQLSSFIGKLTPKQKKLINTMNNELISTFDEWIEFRRAWGNSITAAYANRNNKPVFEKMLSRTILHADEWRSEAYLLKREHNQKVWVNTLEKLLTSLNKKQLKKLNRKLNGTIEDIEDLIDDE
jgi:ABC-type transporter MlaC component